MSIIVYTPEFFNNIKNEVKNNEIDETLKKTIDEFGEDADMSNVALTYEKLTGAKIRP